MTNTKTFEELALEALEALSTKPAVRAYFVTAGACGCGCAGNCHATPVTLKRAVTRVRNLIKAGNVEIYVDPEYVAVDTETRTTVVYFVE